MQFVLHLTIIANACLIFSNVFLHIAQQRDIKKVRSIMEFLKIRTERSEELIFELDQILQKENQKANQG